MPTHWDIHGNVNGWMPRHIGAWLMPFVMAGIGLLLSALPALSPKGYQLDRARPVYNYIGILVMGMLGCMHVVTLQAAMGGSFDIGRAIIGSICVFLALMGNVLPKVQRNFWVGIRTPWTLASEQVWTATHRFAGRLLVAAGALGAILTLLGIPALPILYLIIIAALIPAAYSYVIYQKLDK